MVHQRWEPDKTGPTLLWALFSGPPAGHRGAQIDLSLQNGAQPFSSMAAVFLLGENSHCGPPCPALLTDKTERRSPPFLVTVPGGHLIQASEFTKEESKSQKSHVIAMIIVALIKLLQYGGCWARWMANCAFWTSQKSYESAPLGPLALWFTKKQPLLLTLYFQQLSCFSFVLRDLKTSWSLWPYHFYVPAIPGTEPYIQ